MGKILDYVAPIAADLAANAILPGSGFAAAGLTSGGLDYAHTHNLGGALGTAAGSAIGAGIGNAAFPATGSLGTVGNALGGASINPGSSIATSLGDGLTGSINSAFGSSVGSVGGALAGGDLGGTLGAQLTPPPSPKPAPPWQATMANPMAAPAGMPSGFGGFTPQQQASTLAQQGAYGGGLGPQDQQYFANLVNHQLVNPNQSQNPLSTLSPVENTYLNNLGFGGNTNSNDLLSQLNKAWPQSQ